MEYVYLKKRLDLDEVVTIFAFLYILQQKAFCY